MHPCTWRSQEKISDSQISIFIVRCLAVIPLPPDFRGISYHPANMLVIYGSKPHRSNGACSPRRRVKVTFSVLTESIVE